MFLQQQLDDIENRMVEMSGMKLYRSADGFTQDKIYEYAGAKDYVTTITLRNDSESAHIYGETLIVLFVYFQEERIALEKDATSLNENKNVKVKELLDNIDVIHKKRLLTDGIATEDIVEMMVVPSTKENNTFASPLIRKPNVMEIPFECKGKGEDIDWMYGSLCRYIKHGITLTPEECSEYLAFKFILEPDAFTEDEKKEVFDDYGKMVNQNVLYYWLTWNEAAGLLTDKDKTNLLTLEYNKRIKRLSFLDVELKNMGLSLEKLSNQYPEKASLLIKRVVSFHERRYNIIGKHVMYLSFESFVHIYLRHVKELSVDNQFSERSKFQLEEDDLLTTMNIVLCALNDEYQVYKDAHPNNRFYRKGKMAYYYNGDYYDIDINPDGQIGSFYKRVDK